MGRIGWMLLACGACAARSPPADPSGETPASAISEPGGRPTYRGPAFTDTLAPPFDAHPGFSEIAAGLQVLASGDQGPEVEAVQALLTVWNYCVDGCMTGQYDVRTEAAVDNFGRDLGAPDPDRVFDAGDLGLASHWLEAPMYAAIREAGMRGVRFEAPVRGGETVEEMRRAVAQVAFPTLGADTLLATRPDAFENVEVPEEADVARGHADVWLSLEAFRAISLGDGSVDLDASSRPAEPPR